MRNTALALVFTESKRPTKDSAAVPAWQNSGNQFHPMPTESQPLKSTVSGRSYSPSVTGAKLHASPALVRGIMGPVGSGKSVACVNELIRLASGQECEPGTNIRRSRILVIRKTYARLKSTTIKTWQEWVPREWGSVVFDSPIRCPIRTNLPDGTRMEAEVLFLALDRAQDVERLLSLDASFAWINEARELPYVVLDALLERLGRFPSTGKGVYCTRKCVILDTNPPSRRHWWHRLAEEERPRNWEFFRQPGALIRRQVPDGWEYRPNPLAENVASLGGFNYYLDMVPGKSEGRIVTQILGEYGSDFSGMPVWPEFRESVHVAAKPFLLEPGLPILMGWDFGLTPVAILGQMTQRGQLRIGHELPSSGIGVRRHLAQTVNPFIRNHYPSNVIKSTGDPAGSARAQSNETTCFQELAAGGIPTLPAPTNIFTARRECVAGFLERMVGGEPAILISPDCKVLVEAMGGGYHFPELPGSHSALGENNIKQEPEDNEYTHPADALQYLCLSCDPVLRQRQNVRASGGDGSVIHRDSNVSAAGWA